MNLERFHRAIGANRFQSGSHDEIVNLSLDGPWIFPCTTVMTFPDRPAPPRLRSVRPSRIQTWKIVFFAQRRRAATVAAALLVVGVAFGVVFGHNGLTVYGKKRTETRELDRELKGLAKENDSLAGHVERLQTDPDAIEHQAREELHYTRPGEVIVTLSPDRFSKTQTPRN